MTKHVHAMTVKEAWQEVDKLFPTDYIKDEISSKNAGYPVYRSTCDSLPNSFYNYICDLGNILEINLVNKKWQGKTINVWIDGEKTKNGYFIVSKE